MFPQTLTYKCIQSGPPVSAPSVRLHSLPSPVVVPNFVRVLVTNFQNGGAEVGLLIVSRFIVEYVSFNLAQYYFLTRFRLGCKEES